jgi:hypothetical protein
MSKYIYHLILVSSILYSCNRFDHEKSIRPQECGCCIYSDSIAGTYTGNLLKYELTGFNGAPIVNTILDTFITVDIVRTFEGLNYLEDSIFCQFDISHFYETPVKFTLESIKEGAFYHNDKYLTEFKEPNQFNYKRDGVLDKGKWGKFPYPLVRFYGIKVE